MKSYSKPTNELIDGAIPFLSSPQHEVYFFSRLENPLWISPLAERGVFSHPPKAMKMEEGGIGFPRWPASEYLVRMAAVAPREVAEIMAEFQTDNLSVIGDIIRAAIVMPSNIASSMIQPICRAANEATFWAYFRDASILCAQLAQGDEIASALSLASALFAPAFKRGRKEQYRRDEHWYKEGLQIVVPMLAIRAPDTFLPKLCEWLASAVEANRTTEGEFGNDVSFLWRPAVEEHDQNSDYELAGAMVGFVREGFEVALRDRRLTLDDALQLLNDYPYLIFKRIRIHLIGEFADQNADLARATIMKRDLFDDYKCKHEYTMLVRKRLDLLSEEQKSEWYAWIDVGPDMSDFDESVRRNLGRNATEEDRQGRINFWRFCKLHWVRNHLEGERREFYEKMLVENGEPELADLNFHRGSAWRGDESPMAVEELAQMDFTDAVDAVCTWRPNGRRSVDVNIRGLASTFEKYIATNPVEFSEQACALIGRPAIFVRSFISQMIAAIKTDTKIHLEPVLELCDWVVGRPIGEQTLAYGDHETLVDSDWQWTRDEVSALVESVCKAWDENWPRYSINQFRKRLWELLNSLYRDRAESNVGRDATTEDCRTQDYLLLGINSSRGKAVEAALEYARWIGGQIKQWEGKREIIHGGFDAMPEVREMLEWQISAENRTVEALAVIGSRVGLLYWIDSRWLAENADRLFRLEDYRISPDGASGWAAWNAFLVWVGPHIDYYRCFRSQYAYAIEQSADVELADSSREEPMEQLGQHLVLLYGRGQLDSDEDRQQFWKFLECAHRLLRIHTIAFIGQALQGSEEIPSEIVDRFATLWDQYWERLGKSDVEEMPEEWLFGPWFTCDRFADQWALERLDRFVAVNPNVQPDHSVAEKLEAIASIDIAMSVGILNRVIRNDQEGWKVYSWKDHAWRILELAMNTPGEAHDAAEKVIDYLGRRGYVEFGQLLKGR